MLMWEVSSGQPPFINFEHDYDLAMKIIDGMRPKVIPGTPLKYKQLMEQCWDADPTERPDIDYLFNEINKMRRLYYQNKMNEQINNNTNSSYIDSLVRRVSAIHIFEDLPEPRNATEGK